MPEYANTKLRNPPAPPTIVEAAECDYAELDVTTNFSFLRGASHPDELVYRAAELGYRAIGITDGNSLAGVVRAHDAVRQVTEQGGRAPKLIIGARLTLADGPDLLVWASDRAAYGRLCRLLTLGKRRAVKGECELGVGDFVEYSEGLLAAIVPICNLQFAICNLESEEAESLRPYAILREALAARLSLAACALYGNDDQSNLEALVRLSRRLGIPLLACNHVHYHVPERRMLQDVLTCVRHGCTIHEAGYKLFPNGERYLKSPAQMRRLFDGCPQAIARGLEIAERCSFSLDELRYEYPREVVPEGRTAIAYLTELAWRGAAERYGGRGSGFGRVNEARIPKPEIRKNDEARMADEDAESSFGFGNSSLIRDSGFGLRNLPTTLALGAIPEKVCQLLEHELALIEKLKFEAYFLTVYDLVTFARSRGILCQGRGSAANSAVCYCIGVTSVDPARIDLLFERFISAARDEPPDIDIDFEHERREEVLQYIYEKYGRERAGMTAEVISYRGRSAVRDVGKALGLSLDMVDQMAKKLDWWHRGTLQDEHIRELGLDPADRTVKQVIDLTGQLLGFPRHLSQHVGGMVMTRGPLCELVPIENASMENRTVIEWDKDDIDALGILKVDCLGLGMLTCISKAFRLVEERGQNPNDEIRMTNQIRSPNDEDTFERSFELRDSSLICHSSFVIRHSPTRLALHTIPPEDPAVYDMLCDADTIGVFQIESRAQMSMLPRLRPRCFYDLVIEVAIVRPGPIQGNMVHPYLRRRNGEEPVSYPSEALRQVLAKTLGVPLFQEQAMRVAMVGAGFSAEEADKLRRAMAAWRKGGAIDAFHQKIIEGMLRNGYTREFAEQCFLQIRGFGEYGFPESHAASFALLVYVSAWLKRYHPAAFAAALLNSQPMGFYAPAQIVRDAREHGVEVRAVDVNFSQWDCTLEEGFGVKGSEREFGVQGSGFRKETKTRIPKPEIRINDEARMTNEGSLIDKHTWGHGGPAVRLGFRQIKGLRQGHAEEVVVARRKMGRLESIPQFQRTTALPRHVIQRLAEADAFASLSLSRRQALWQVLALSDAPAPLFDAQYQIENRKSKIENALPPMPLGQEVMTDYFTAGLSLKRHPVWLVRDQLAEKDIITAAELQNIQHGKWVRVAGLVLVRQRPGTASGIVFETLEDETGIVNLIVRPNIYDKYRLAARHSALLHAEGVVERQGQVIHVMVWRMYDLSDMLAGYQLKSRDFH